MERASPAPFPGGRPQRAAWRVAPGSRRIVRPVVLVLLAVVAALPAPMERAAVHAARGEGAQALALIADAGANDSTAHLLRACVALEAGQLLEAGRATAALVDAAPDTLDAKVLPALVSRRAALPQEQWLDSLAAAFEAAGLPDANSSTVRRTHVDVQHQLSDDALHPLRGSADEFLVRVGLAERVDAALIQRAFAELARRDGTPAAWWIAASILTSDEVPLAQRSVARAAARRLAERIVIAAPDDGYAALAVVLLAAEAERPLTMNELSDAEAALRRGTLRLPLGVISEGVRRAWERVDPAQADARAFAAASRHFVPEVHVTLRRRVEAAATETGPRATGLLVEVSKRLATVDTMLDRSVASALALTAAELRAPRSSVPQARAARAALFRFWASADGFPPLGWLIPSLLRERWRREVVDGASFRRPFVPPDGIYFVLEVRPKDGTRVEAKVADFEGRTRWSASQTAREEKVVFLVRTAADREQVLEVVQSSANGKSCRAGAVLQPERLTPFATLAVEREGDRCRVVVQSLGWDPAAPVVPSIGDFPPLRPKRLDVPLGPPDW